MYQASQLTPSLKPDGNKLLLDTYNITNYNDVRDVIQLNFCNR